MVATSLTIPAPDKEKGQRSLDVGDIYFLRSSPTWLRPNAFTANAWRNFVKSQPIAMICRNVLIDKTLSLDWKIVARDSTKQDELKSSIKYYTNLIDKGAYSGLDYSSLVEFVMQDMLDISFGGAVEIGRKGDTPNGRVMWIRPIDGGTLYPTLNDDFPVVQWTAFHNPIPFPKHAIARIFLMPRTEIEREGWGMAPPEQIFFAMEMVGKGDGYYANLLLDIPPAGILDLMDMDANSAKEWVNSYKDFMVNGGNSSFKIPVLYEHNQDIKFISLGKAPNDIMYDKITLKYASIVAAGYGLGLSDIGLQSSIGGETLAGSIRQQRQTHKTSFAKDKKKIKYFWDSILPDNLEFRFIDYDDEQNVATSRARLANATAFGQFITDGVFSPDELRAQSIADGLITISVPEKLTDAERAKFMPNKETKPTSPERPGAIGTKEPASSGGMGEVVKSFSVLRPKNLLPSISKLVDDVSIEFWPTLVDALDVYGDDYLDTALEEINDSIFDTGSSLVDDIVQKSKTSWINPTPTDSTVVLFSSLVEDKDSVDTVYKQFRSSVQSTAKSFLVRAILLSLASESLSGEGIDLQDDSVYHSIVDNVKSIIYSRFDEIIKTSIELSLLTTLGKTEE